MRSDEQQIRRTLSSIAAFHSGIQIEAATKQAIAEKEAIIAKHQQNIDGLTTRLAHVEQFLDSKQCTGTDEAGSSNVPASRKRNLFNSELTPWLKNT